MHESLAPQDGFYTLVERSGAEEGVTVVGSLAGLFAGDSSSGLLDATAGGGDRIDPSRIDAKPALAGDQAFALVGAANFSGGGAAQVRYRQSGADTFFVEADTGDGMADLAFRVQRLVAFAATDLALRPLRFELGGTVPSKRARRTGHRCAAGPLPNHARATWGRRHDMRRAMG